MLNSKDKGNRGERELATKLTKLGYASRRTQQYCGEAGDPDVIGLPGIHAECKRVERLNIHDAMNQAKSDAKATGDTPVVFHRKNRTEWLVTMRLEDWVKLYDDSQQTQTQGE